MDYYDDLLLTDLPRLNEKPLRELPAFGAI